MIALFAVAAAVAAPALPLPADRPSAVYASVGLDDAVLASTVGYARRLTSTVDVGADLAMPWTSPDLHDVQGEVWAGSPLPIVGGFASPVRVGLVVRSTENDTFRAVAIGTELEARPGWYAPKWGVAASLGWRESWLTWLRSSDYYREELYDAPTGWYATTGGTLRAGARADVLVGRVELGLSAGWQGNGRYSVLLPPVYASAVGAVRF